jgi:hypothetical protein
MRVSAAISLLALICAAPATASELPLRKPGLWQVKTTIENNNAQAEVIQQCIDAATDQMLQSSAGPFSPSACPERNVKRSENGMTIESVCSVGGKAATAHSVVTGSFDSAYAMTVTSQSEEFPGGRMTMTMEAKWLGPCAADQKPGDIVMSNGAKINIPEMEKRSLSSGTPLPPK